MYSGLRTLQTELKHLLINLPASFVPTAFQQIARIIDTTQRETFDTDPVKRAWNKVKAKIPYLSTTIEPKIAASGLPFTKLSKGAVLALTFLKAC